MQAMQALPVTFKPVVLARTFAALLALLALCVLVVVVLVTGPITPGDLLLVAALIGLAAVIGMLGFFRRRPLSVSATRQAAASGAASVFILSNAVVPQRGGESVVVGEGWLLLEDEVASIWKAGSTLKLARGAQVASMPREHLRQVSTLPVAAGWGCSLVELTSSTGKSFLIELAGTSGSSFAWPSARALDAAVADMRGWSSMPQ